MATMFPEELPNRVRRDPKRHAEIIFYDNLRWQLPVDWTVFYSVAWLGLVGNDGTPHDGETDFILAHPYAGILLVEVKGGRIHYDPAEGQWYSTDRQGQKYRISPFEQVRKCKHALLEKLKSLPSWSRVWIPLGHAVAFPDAVLSGSILPPDALADIILDSSALPNLFQRIREICSFWRGQDPRPFVDGAALVRDVTSLLAPRTVLRNPLSVQVAEEDREFVRLTEEQYRILDVLNRTRRAAISGCAGSGKTMLGVEKAERLAREGFHTLLTCRSQPLADYLNRITEDLPLLTVNSFLDLCHNLAQQADLTLPADADEAALADVLSRATRGCPGHQFDAIVVDEGQDFPDLWWLALDDCLRDKQTSVCYIFYDDNQRIYATSDTIPADLPVFQMGENVRNTRAIHHALKPYYDGPSGSLSRGPSGRNVETIPYNTEGDLLRHLSRLLHRLTVTEGISASDLVVLTPRPFDSSRLLGTLLDSGHRLVSEPDPRRREVLCAGVTDFKGLERAVVIVAELDPSLLQDPTRRNTVCYVAFSRPRSHLVLLGYPDVLAAIHSCAL